jgi:transposase
MKKRQKRQSFSKEFKLEAIRLAKSSNRPKTQIAEELGISDVTLYKWCKAYQKNQSHAFQDTRPTTDQQRLRNLQLELERVKEERDILKKAVAFFARESE